MPSDGLPAPGNSVGDFYAGIMRAGRTEAAGPAGTAAERRERLRDAFIGYMRERLGEAEASDAEVLSRIAALPGPEEDALQRRLAAAAGLYGGKAGENDIAPVQTRYLEGQLALALTEEVDWAAELAAPPPSGAGITCEGTVLHGADGLSVAQAAAAAKDRIQAVLTSRLGDWAAPMADGLAPMLIGDPTLFLPQPPEGVAYGSLEWARLWIGIEYAEGAGLDPAQLSTDQLLALGRAATTASPAPDGEDGATAGEEEDPATAYRITKLLVLIARAKGRLGEADITEENRAAVERVLDEAAQEVFEEEFAIAEALETLGREMPTRKELAREILKEDADRQITYECYDDMGPYSVMEDLSEYYFQHGNLDGAENFDGTAVELDVPDLSAAFESRFESYRDSFPEAMATVIDRSVANYAKSNDLSLDGATITVSQPVIEAERQSFGPGWLMDIKQWSRQSSTTFFIDITFPDSAVRGFVLSLAEIGKGLQELPSGTARGEWTRANSGKIFDAELLAVFDSQLQEGFSPGTCAPKQIASGTRQDVQSGLVDFYGSLIEASHDQLRGQTDSEATRNFFLDLIPFRAMIVAIQKGDVAGAIVSGLFDVLSFIPFAGEGIKALRVGSRAVSTGLSAALRTGLRQGLSRGLSFGISTTASFGREFGGQLIKTAATGLENVLPIPMPEFASSIPVATTRSTSRIAAILSATQPELAEALQQAARRADLLETTQAPRHPLAPSGKAELEGRLSEKGGGLGGFFSRKLKIRLPADTVLADTPTYRGIKPDLTEPTAGIQGSPYYSDRLNEKRSGICASLVSNWLRRIVYALPKGFDRIKLVEAQADYSDTFRGTVSDKSLLVRRGLEVDHAFPISDQRQISDVLKFVAARKQRYIYMGFSGKSGSGHAVGLAWGERPQFFDPNWGVFEFQNSDQLVSWVSEYIKKNYKNISRVYAFSVQKNTWTKLPRLDGGSTSRAVWMG